MSFDLVPASLIFKIFHQLPFKDRVRLSGVNRLFKVASTESINRMKSLVVNDDLVAYSMWNRKLSSLFESCSQTLESIEINNGSTNKLLLNALTEFVYPKLERLTISITTANDEIAKKLISRNRNVRSVVLHLNGEFKWPEDVVLDKLERLEIRSSYGSRGIINLSPTLRPLIGKVPNLKYFSIDGITTDRAKFELPVQEFSQLLATTPLIQELQLSGQCYISNGGNFMAALLTWHLPNLTSLVIGFYIPSSILHGFPSAFPRLKSFKSERIFEIDDQAVVALSQLNYLKELRLPDLGLTNDDFTKLVIALPSIVVLEIKEIVVLEIEEIGNQALMALSQLVHLREFCLTDMDMTEAQIVDVITSVPSISILGISEILDVCSPLELIHFLTSTAALFQRNVEIRLGCHICAEQLELGHLNAIMKDMEKIDGPVVIMDNKDVKSIRYRSLDG